jgi:hypothetical protein
MSPGVPILKSKDLSNWEMVSYCYDTLGDKDELNLLNGKSNYGKGTWASCFRYHNNRFYVSTFSQTTNQTYIFSTDDPESGKWEKRSFTPSCHDHSIFFDDDGHTYIIWGAGKLFIAELEEDLSGIKEGSRRVLIEDASQPSGTVGLQAEGSQLFKVNGTYNTPEQIKTIQIIVYKPGFENGIELYARTGEPACKILVDDSFGVIPERKNIANEYKKFTNYVQGSFVDDFWWK